MALALALTLAPVRVQVQVLRVRVQVQVLRVRVQVVQVQVQVWAFVDWLLDPLDPSLAAHRLVLLMRLRHCPMYPRLRSMWQPPEFPFQSMHR